MSQYPPSQFPYTPPPAPRPSPSAMAWHLLSPARAAGVMQMVMGGVLILTSTCFGAAAWVAPLDQILKQMKSQNPSMELPPVSIEALRLVFIAFGVMLLLTGVALIVLAIFVRGGGRIAAALSLGLNGLIGLVLLLAVLRSLAQFSSSGADAILALMVSGSMAGLCGATIAKLIEALRASVNLPAAPMPPSWPMGQQQIGGYGQTGEGAFGYPPPPPAGAAPVGLPQAPPAAGGKFETRNSNDESNSKFE